MVRSDAQVVPKGRQEVRQAGVPIREILALKILIRTVESPPPWQSLC